MQNVSGRGGVLPRSDEVSRLFRQTENGRCGHAAAAFAATWLGDIVFEEDVVGFFGGDWMHLRGIAGFLRLRGFAADAFVGGDISVEISARPGSLAIVHLRTGHFVVIMKRGDVFGLFDPAVGDTVELVPDALVAASGAWLLVRHAPPVRADGYVLDDASQRH